MDTPPSPGAAAPRRRYWRWVLGALALAGVLLVLVGGLLAFLLRSAKTDDQRGDACIAWVTAAQAPGLTPAQRLALLHDWLPLAGNFPFYNDEIPGAYYLVHQVIGGDAQLRQRFFQDILRPACLAPPPDLTAQHGLVTVGRSLAFDDPAFDALHLRCWVATAELCLGPLPAAAQAHEDRVRRWLKPVGALLEKLPLIGDWADEVTDYRNADAQEYDRLRRFLFNEPPARQTRNVTLPTDTARRLTALLGSRNPDGHLLMLCAPGLMALLPHCEDPVAATHLMLAELVAMTSQMTLLDRHRDLIYRAFLERAPPAAELVEGCLQAIGDQPQEPIAWLAAAARHLPSDSPLIQSLLAAAAADPATLFSVAPPRPPPTWDALPEVLQHALLTQAAAKVTPDQWQRALSPTLPPAALATLAEHTFPQIWPSLQPLLNDLGTPALPAWPAWIMTRLPAAERAAFVTRCLARVSDPSYPHNYAHLESLRHLLQAPPAISQPAWQAITPLLEQAPRELAERLLPTLVAADAGLDAPWRAPFMRRWQAYWLPAHLASANATVPAWVFPEHDASMVDLAAQPALEQELAMLWWEQVMALRFPALPPLLAPLRQHWGSRLPDDLWVSTRDGLLTFLLANPDLNLPLFIGQELAHPWYRQDPAGAKAIMAPFIPEARGSAIHLTAGAILAGHARRRGGAQPSPKGELTATLAIQNLPDQGRRTMGSWPPLVWTELSPDSPWALDREKLPSGASAWPVLIPMHRQGKFLLVPYVAIRAPIPIESMLLFIHLAGLADSRFVIASVLGGYQVAENQPFPPAAMAPMSQLVAALDYDDELEFIADVLRMELGDLTHYYLGMQLLRAYLCTRYQVELQDRPAAPQNDSVHQLWWLHDRLSQNHGSRPPRAAEPTPAATPTLPDTPSTQDPMPHPAPN